MNGTQYRCVVTGAGGTVEGNAATLTVNEEYNLTISATAKDGKVIVSWEKPSKYDVAGYELYVTPEGEPETSTPILIQDGEAISYTVETLHDGTEMENGRTYRFRLVALYAHDGIVEGIQSNPASAIPNPLY